MRCYSSHRAGRETNECVFIKSLSLLRVLQFAEGSGQWWFPRVSREIHQRVHPQVSILRHYAAAAAGAQHRSCGHCESGSLHINMTIATLCLMSLRTWLHLETMPLSYDCWSKSKTWCFSVFFCFFSCCHRRATTPQLCRCWLRPSQVRSASWMQSFVLPAERKERRRDAPSVKWWLFESCPTYVYKIF